MMTAFVTVYVLWLLLCVATEIRDRRRGAVRRQILSSRGLR